MTVLCSIPEILNNPGNTDKSAKNGAPTAVSLKEAFLKY